VFWRKFILDWSNAAGELLIIVGGVLIALAINQWNDDRLERAEEIDAISRILTDIQSDLQDFDVRLKAVGEKEESLLRVRNTLAEGRPNDPRRFLRDIIVGADFGWNQGLAERATYDDLLGSGKLGIIEDPNIRFRIATYYGDFEDSHNRIEERETAYPDLSYQLVPRGISNIERPGLVLERELESSLSEAQLNELVAMAQASPIKDYVTAEINLARFIHAVSLDLQGQALSLTQLLEDYRTAIQ